MITSISATNGEVVKKKYDYVSRGDVIISGTIKNKEDEVKKVPALGKVMAEVWYKVRVEVPKVYHEETETGKKKKVLSLFFVGHEMSLELKNYNNYSFKETKIFQNNLLPIKLVILEKREIKKSSAIYNISNVDKKAITLARSKFKDNEITFEKVLKKTIKDSKIVVDIFFKIREDITDYDEIADLELHKGVEENE